MVECHAHEGDWEAALGRVALEFPLDVAVRHAQLAPAQRVVRGEDAEDEARHPRGGHGVGQVAAVHLLTAKVLPETRDTEDIRAPGERGPEARRVPEVAGDHLGADGAERGGGRGVRAARERADGPAAGGEDVPGHASALGARGAGHKNYGSFRRYRKFGGGWT